MGGVDLDRFAGAVAERFGRVYERRRVEMPIDELVARVPAAGSLAGRAASGATVMT